MPEPTIIEHDGIRYRVRVSVGTTASTSPKDMHILNVNDVSNPFMVDTDEFVGHVAFMIKGQDRIWGYEAGQKQDGLKPVPDSKWFENAAKAGRGENINCLQIVGRFKREWTGDQVIFATVFERPLKLPPFTSVALRFIKAIYTGLQVDVCCPQPYFIGQLLNSTDTVHVTSVSSTILLNGEYKDKKIPQWPSYHGEILVEDTSLVIPPEEIKRRPKLSTDPAARRQHFSKAKHYSKHRYLTDHVYGFELFNPFLDCARFSVKLAGFNIDLFKYFNGQPLTYSIRTQDASVTFLTFVIDLVPVEDLATV
ncbi:MAG: hypothetical protein JOS17DRAFT_842236 [Linnemannia elongata]|nr:MAG: hypothetical protein JOS17DRAFT_842236 [Linnemannia elongata]